MISLERNANPRVVGEATVSGCMVTVRGDMIFLTRHYEEYGHPVLDVVRIPLEDVTGVTTLLSTAGAELTREQEIRWQELLAKGEVF